MRRVGITFHLKSELVGFVYIIQRPHHIIPPFIVLSTHWAPIIEPPFARFEPRDQVNPLSTLKLGRFVYLLTAMQEPNPGLVLETLRKRSRWFVAHGIKVEIATLKLSACATHSQSSVSCSTPCASVHLKRRMASEPFLCLPNGVILNTRESRE